MTGKMATKNCPHCSKQVPVACKKCACGHVFFATRRQAASVGGDDNSEPNSPDATSASASGASISSSARSAAAAAAAVAAAMEHLPTRRSGRVTRERPNFYDALEYENQTRRDQKEGLGKEDRTFRHIFVTVGSTQFPELVELVCSPSMSSLLSLWSTEQIIIQGGKGSSQAVPPSHSKSKIKITMYDYKQSLREDMEWADLIIAHAGAGTAIEALDLGKPLILVPNRGLMDDHQLELAGKLQEGKHAFLTSIQDFYEDVKDICKSGLKPLPERQGERFARFLNNQKQLLRQTKAGKSEDQDEGSDEGPSQRSTQSSSTLPSQESRKSESKSGSGGGGGLSGEPKGKKRRGRPPGITGSRKQPPQGYKINNQTTTKTRRPSNGHVGRSNGPGSPDEGREAADQALLSTISVEKAIQYNIVLQDINRKISRASWSAIL